MLGSPSYSVQSHVPREIFLNFVQNLADPSAIEVTATNFSYYAALAREFQIDSLQTACQPFEGADTFSAVDEFLKAQVRISELEASIAHWDRQNELAVAENLRLRAEQQKINDAISQYKTAIFGETNALREQILEFSSFENSEQSGTTKFNTTVKVLENQLEVERAEVEKMEKQIAEMRTLLENGRKTLESFLSDYGIDPNQGNPDVTGEYRKRD
jgi:chromosome segregation ATPase